MINRNLAKVLSFRYKILALVLILIAGSLVFLPKYAKHEGIDPESALANAISPERYISADELAHKIIGQDPSILIIDLREIERFEAYSIPGAINIPLTKILEEEGKAYLEQDAYEVILYSEENFYADQAWMLCNRIGYNNLRVLEGGMNSWFNSVINPPVPTDQMPSTAFDLYSFRKSASMFFGVAYPEEIQEVKEAPKPKSKPKQVVPVKKKKKKMPEGGC